MNEVAKLDQFQIGPKEIKTLERATIIPPNTPADQIAVFAQVCREKGLSPFSKEIYLVQYNGKNGPTWNVITGIDGMRKRAANTGEFAGRDEPQYNRKSDGSFMSLFEIKQSGKLPISCRVTIYRLVAGIRVPYVGEVLFDEYAQRYRGELSGKWKSMPYHMIAKCAEAQALREGFSDQVSGLHIAEERAAYEDMNTGPILPKDKLAEREKELNLIKKNVSGLSLEDARKLYSDNPQWRNDEEITQIFLDHADKIKAA